MVLQSPLLKSKSLKWAAVGCTLITIYSFIYYLYYDKYQTNSNVPFKYDISAEIFKRILFTGDIEKIDDYCLDVYGEEYNVLENGFASVVNDERPLYFLFLSFIKLFDKFPLGINYFVNVFLLLGSICLFALAFRPNNTFLFVLLGGTLLSPFIVYHATIYDPRILEIFLTCAGLYFYRYKKWVLAFLFISLSVFVHPANMALLGCLFLFHIYSNPRNWSTFIQAMMGCLTGWLGIEMILSILFAKDQYGIFPHRFIMESFLFWHGRASFESINTMWRYPEGFINYWRNSFILLPMSTVGIFWIKSKFQFAVTLFPVIIFFAATLTYMVPHKALLPIYFLGFGFFLLHFLVMKHLFARFFIFCFIIIGLASSLSYYTFVFSKSLSLIEDYPVALAKDYDRESLGSRYPRSKLYWNLKRFNEVKDTADVTYNMKMVSLMHDSNIPSPSHFYPHFIFQLASRFMTEKTLRKLGVHSFGPVSAVLVRKVAKE